MQKARLGVLLVGLALILAACGRVAPGPSATESQSPSSRASQGTPSTLLTIPGPALHAGEVGLTYVPVTYQATGGNSPYLWTVTSGSLPSGLSLSPEGVIAGTPAASGTFKFTVGVTDAGIATANLTASIVIVPTLTASLTHSGSVAMRVGSPAATAAFASQAGGNPPYSYSVTAGALPPGTTLTGLSISGAFSSTGMYRFTVTVADSLGGTAAVSPTYNVWGAIAFPPMWYTPTNTADHRFAYSDAECRGTNATGCTVEFPYSGGTPGVTPIVSQAYWQAAWQGIPGYAPGQDPDLHGLSVTVSAGAVHLTVAPNANPNGWTGGKMFVVLTDPQTHESTRPGEFRINIFS